MADQAAPANPLFAEAPVYDWRVFEDPGQMLTSFLSLINWIINTVLGQQPQITQEVGGNQYTFRLTADEGFFRVRMFPPQEWGGQQPLHLVFSCRDLYLVGFMHGGQWLVFDDARLDGSGHNEHPQAYRFLGFDGRYINTHFTTVQIGTWFLYQSYDCLVHYTGRSRQEIVAAVYRIIVAVSEACRFPEWRARVQLLLENMTAETADFDRVFSDLFKRWSTTSKRARRGADRFEVQPGDGFPTFERLLQNLHTGVATCQPPDDEL